MSRAEYIRLLDRQVERWQQTNGRSGISTEERDEALRAFDAGEIVTDALPLPESDATVEVTGAAALAALVAGLQSAGRNIPNPAAAVRLVTSGTLGGGHDLRATIFERLFNIFGQDAAQSAGGATDALRRFHTAMQQSLVQDTLAAAQLGRGRPLTPAELEAIQSTIQRQLGFLKRFTDEIAARAAGGRSMSPAQIAARMRSYRGEMRAAFFDGASQRFSQPGYIAIFEGSDDGSTCGPCLAAQAGSPYLPSDPALPLPGTICLGGGACRDVLRFVFDTKTYGGLIG